jgi:hypothetical protein
MKSPGRAGAIVAAMLLLVLASVTPTSAQTPPQGDPPKESGDRESAKEPPQPIAELSPLPQQPSVPSARAYPLELLGLLGSPPEPGPTTLIPSLALYEEYTDNLFLDNRQRKWELITGFSPAMALFVERPLYRLTAGYSFGGQLYARESRFNNAVDRQNLVASGSYQLSPLLTLSAFDSFAMNRNTNLTVTQGFSTGRQESWTNTVGAGMNWRLTRTVSVNAALAYEVLRFSSTESTSTTGTSGTSGTPGADSDTYRAQGTLSDVLTPRLTATAGYAAAYFDFLGQADNSITHTPTVGGSYQITPTLTGVATAGPSITEVGGQTFINPAVTARLIQTWQIGSASLQYARAVDVAGGFGGPTTTETFSAILALPAWQRGLVLLISPAYSTAKSVSNRQTGHAGNLDVTAFTLPVAATYRVNRYTSLFAGYTFFHQRAGSGSTAGQTDVDDNRFRFGLQFGYPIRLP